MTANNQNNKLAEGIKALEHGDFTKARSFFEEAIQEGEAEASTYL